MSDTIYDFESALEGGLQSFIDAGESGIKAYTTLDAAELQRDRPRAELEFVLGAGQGQFIQIKGEPRETSWDGQFLIDLVTNDDIKIHSAYRTALRALMHGIGGSLNDAYLHAHVIQPFFLDGGTTPMVKPEDGYMRTRMVFNVKVSIQADAWATFGN